MNLNKRIFQLGCGCFLTVFTSNETIPSNMDCVVHGNHNVVGFTGVITDADAERTA